MSASPVNGNAGAVDLGALRATDEQKAEAAERAMFQAGLVCQCGERIRGEAVHYFVVVQGRVNGPQGPQLAVRAQQHVVCSRTCTHAQLLELTAIARRQGPAGRVTWLDELRAKREVSEG